MTLRPVLETVRPLPTADPGRDTGRATAAQDVVLDPDADSTQFLGHEQVIGLEVQPRLYRQHHACGQVALGVGLGGSSRAVVHVQTEHV